MNSVKPGTNSRSFAFPKMSLEKEEFMELTETRPIGELLYFCDSPEAISLITRKDLPKEIWETVRKLQQLDTWWNWRILFFYVLWGLSGWILLLNIHFAVNLFCILVNGCCIYGIPGLMHESSHSLLSKNVFVNRWLGFISGLPGLVSITAYRSIHSYHHAHTSTDDDPDSIENSAPKSLPIVVAYLIVLFLGIYVYIVTTAINGYKKGSPTIRKDILVEYTLIASVVLGMFLLYPSSAVVHVWVFPLLIAAQLTNIRGIAEHGMTTGGNPFINTRTVISNRAVSFFMCNLNYHLEHHLFPGIPWYHLPAVHRLLQDEYRKTGSSVYRSYMSFLLDFFRTTRSGLVLNVRLLPAHIRDELCV